MINVKEYSGHIRNWSALCERLGIDHSLSREDRARRRPVLRDARMDIHFGTYFIKLPYFQNSIPINTMDFHNTYCYYNHQF